MATYYWVGGTGSWTDSSTSNWSTTSGGGAGAGPPTSADIATFDANSGTGTVFPTGGICLDIAASTAPATLAIGGNLGNSIYVYGSVNIGANFASAFYGFELVMLSSTAGRTVTISNATAVSSITYAGTGSWTQSASTVNNPYSQTAINIAFGAGTVTFSGSIVTNEVSMAGGTLVGGAFAHFIRNSNSTSQRFLAYAGTLNLTNTTLNIGTTLASGDTATTNFFYVDSPLSLTTTGSTINLGSSTSGSFANNNFSGGGKTYNTVNINGGGSVSGNNTFGTLVLSGVASAGSANSFSIESLAVTNVFTMQGANIAPDRILVSASGGIAATITLSGAGAKTFIWVDVQDITLSVTGATPTFTSVGDCFGNTGFTFTPTVTRYAVSGGVSKNFSSTTLWSASSGGATGATSPLPQDSVVFDSNANAEVVFNMPRIGKDVTFNTGVGFVATMPFSTYYFFGQPNAEAFNKLQNIALTSRSSISIPFGVNITNLSLTGVGGTYTLQGNITISEYLYPFQGSFYSSGFSVTLGAGVISATYAGSWFAGTSTISAREFYFDTSGTFSLASATLVMSFVTYNPAIVVGSGRTIGTVNFSDNGSTQRTLFLSSANLTISKLVNSGSSPKFFALSSGNTLTVGTLEISGSSSSPVLFSPISLSAGTTPATLNLTNSVTTSFVAFCLITKTGAGTINATGVANLGRNTGITFSSTLYGICYTGFVGSSTSGSFTVPSDFSGSSMLVVVGGGGGGAKRSVTTGTAGGGGAGALGVSSNLPISPGQTIYFSAGRGGVGGTISTGQSGLTGGDSWLNITSNFAPSISSEGASAAGGNPSLLNSTSGGTGGTSAVGLITASGGSGGAGFAATTAGAGGGGSAPRMFTTVLAGYAGRAGASGNSGGGGGGGYGGTGGLASTTTGGLGGLNSLGAQASGGTAGNPGSAGTSGGGGGGGGGATTGTAGAGGVGVVAPDFTYTRLNGVSSTGTIGPGGGGGGGGTATSTGTGGAGGDNQASYGGAGGGGGGRGGTVATNGNGGNGSGGFVLFVYTVSTTTPKSQGSIIG